MLGRAFLSVALATSGRQAGKAIAAPVAFKKDRLDTRIRSIDIVPCIALPLTHSARLTARIFYLPVVGSIHDSDMWLFGKQMFEDGTRMPEHSMPEGRRVCLSSSNRTTLGIESGYSVHKYL